MHKRIDDAILMQSSKCTQAVLDVLANRGANKGTT